VSGEEAFAWYKLFRAEGFGPKARQVIWDAVQRGDFSLEELFDMDSAQFEARLPALGKGRLNAASSEVLQFLDEEALYEEYQALKDQEIEVVHPGHALYPESVARLEGGDALPFLFCRGVLSLLKTPGVAIVGSRNASDEGIEIARTFGAELALEGENVISGYAKGIDMAAHSGALEKEGTTTIVLSHGILYFSQKKMLEDVDLESNGLIVSQFDPKARWNPGNAMIRNKLVCALSKAVIVVESGSEMSEDGGMSGTFDAGKSALEMGVPLFVVSPDAFKKPPAGNKALIARSGIETKPDDGVRTILEYLKTNKTGEQDRVACGEQLTLF
jgi:DNA processing protein